MSDKKQTIQEALAAVQRKINEQREAYARSLYEGTPTPKITPPKPKFGADPKTGKITEPQPGIEAEAKAGGAENLIKPKSVKTTKVKPTTAPSNSISGSNPTVDSGKFSQTDIFGQPMQNGKIVTPPKSISDPIDVVTPPKPTVKPAPSTTSSTGNFNSTGPQAPAPSAPNGKIGFDYKSKIPTIAIGGAALGTGGVIAALNKNQSPTASASTDDAPATQPGGVSQGGAVPLPRPRPAPPQPQRRPSETAPKAPAPKSQAASEVDTAAIYKKHGVGSDNEDTGAFHRAEAEIARAKGGKAPNDFADIFNKSSGSSKPSRPSETPRPNSAPEKTGGSSKGGNMDMSDIFKGDDTPKTQTASNSPTNSSGSYRDKTMSGRQSNNVEDRRNQSQIDNDETAESGPSKGKKKMSESVLINAFLKLQKTEAGNIFEAAKKMKSRYEGGVGDGTIAGAEYGTSGGKKSDANDPAIVYNQYRGAGDEQYKRNKDALDNDDEPSSIGKGIDKDILDKYGIDKDKKKPEDYFKKDSPNAAEKPSEDEIDRRMRVALGHSKGPEDYFKIPSAPKTTEIAKDKEPDNDDDDKNASADTSISVNSTDPVSFYSKSSKSVSVAKKRKMSESTLIDAFLKINESKKAKKDYDGDGKVESGKDEYLGSRIAAAKKAGKMEEELKGKQKNIDANNNGKIDGDDFRKLRSGKKSEKIKAYRADRDKHGEMEEETDPGFSEAELAHFASVLEGGPVDQKSEQRRLRTTTGANSRGIGDTVPNRDLTDEFEYIDEMARGVKAGQKRGSYKGKAHKGGADAKGASMPDEEPKGVPHVLDQIRHGREDEHGFKTITHPASSPEAPVTKKIHRSDLHGFYDKYHNTEKPAAKEKEYSGFLDKHFGDSRTSAPTSQSVTTDLSKVEKANLKGGAGKVSLGGSKLVGGKK